MPAWPVDGMDVLAVAARPPERAVDRGPRRRRPVFLELRTYRFRAHSMYDPERYRDKEEVEQWKQRDPIDRCLALLATAGRAELGRRRGAAIEAEVAAEIDAAVAVAERRHPGAGRGPDPVRH